MIRPILEWPHPKLAERSWPTGPGPKTDELVRDLIDTMKDARGVGIAAIQVGVPVRLFVLDIGSGPEVYINPAWALWKGTDEVMLDEGCLSMREGGRPIMTLVPRFERINAVWMDERGAVRDGKLRGLRAQAFQHEHDHLEGRLVLVDWIKR